MMTKKKEKCRGYITGKSIEQGFVPQQVQNIVVRNYCKNNDIEYLWSAVEFLMPNSYFHLENILNDLEQVDGVVFYSLHLMPENRLMRKRIYDTIVKKKKKIHFAVENFFAWDEKSCKKIEKTILIKKALPYCINNISQLKDAFPTN